MYRKDVQVNVYFKEWTLVRKSEGGEKIAEIKVHQNNGTALIQLDNRECK